MKNDFKTKLKDFDDYFSNLNEQRIEDLKKKTNELSKSISKPIIETLSPSINVIMYQKINDWLKSLKESGSKIVFETVLIDKKEFEQEPLFSHVQIKDWFEDPQILTEEENESNPYYFVFPMIEDIDLIEGVEYGFLSGGFLHKIHFNPWEDKEEEIQQKISDFSQFIDEHRNLASEKIEDEEDLWEEGLKQDHQEIIDYCIKKIKSDFFFDSYWRSEHIKRIRPEFNKEANTYLKKILEQQQVPESKYYFYEKYIVNDLNDFYNTGKEFVMNQLLELLKNETELKVATNYQARYLIIQKKAKEIPDSKLFTLSQNDMKRLFLQAKLIWNNSA